MIRQHGSSGGSVKHYRRQGHHEVPVEQKCGFGGDCGWLRPVMSRNHCGGIARGLVSGRCTVQGIFRGFMHADISCANLQTSPEVICINPRHELSTAVREILICIGTMFATAPELIHRHAVMEGGEGSGASKTSLGREENNTNSSLPHLLKLCVHKGESF